MVQESKPASSWTSLLSKAPFATSVFDFAVRTAKSLILSQLSGLKSGIVLIEDVDGTKTVVGTSSDDSSSEIELHFHNPQAWLRIALGNEIGFAEAFMLGQITCSNLPAFFRLILSSPSAKESKMSFIVDLIGNTTALLNNVVNTSSQALANATSHYSVSNEMFEAFLDPTMTYSAPIWLPKSHPEASSDTLELAQKRKLQYTIQAARIKPTDHVLEIGTGWGSFAIEAVRSTGCRVTTITASSEQAKLAKERIDSAGFSERIEVLVCDYRHIPLPSADFKFDKIVSIEMIEHVGYAFLNTYFSIVDRHLKTKGGIAVFQCITIPEPRYADLYQRKGFIPRYIFPGGYLPSVSGLIAAINAGSKGSLIVEDMKSVSGHYVRALREWREKFLRNWETKVKPALKLSHPGMSDADVDVFGRKWEYYFAYCEAGFAAKVLGDVSITVGRDATTELIADIPF